MPDAYMQLPGSGTTPGVLIPVDAATRLDEWELIADRGPLRISAESLADRLSGLSNLLNDARNQVVAMPAPPDEVEIEMGIRFTVEGGIVVAKGSSEASLLVRVRWSGRPSEAVE